MISLALLALKALLAAEDPAPLIAGRWLTDDRKAVVQISPCGDRWCGTLVEIRDPAAPSTDVNNPDPALRSHRLIGTVVLTRLQATGAEWRGGRAYDPKTGRRYRASVRLAGRNVLAVTGCVLFICQTKTWSRV